MNRESERAVIASLIASQADAWNRGDAKALAHNFLSDGCFVNILGMQTYGREPFEIQHAKIFSTVYKGSLMKLPVRRIHFLRDDVALVDLDAELSGYLGLPPGVSAGSDGILRTRLQEVLVKESGKWMIASFHNVDVKSAP
jgi:uncharacterized protein (TIGR02246 family)